MDMVDRAWNGLFGVTSHRLATAATPRPVAVQPEPPRTYRLLEAGQLWKRSDGGRSIKVVEITDESVTVVDEADASRFTMKQTTLRRVYRLEAP